MDGRVSVTSPLQGEQLADEWMYCEPQEAVEHSDAVHQWWWYRLTTPAGRVQREVVLRTRIASLLLFFLLLLLVICVLPLAILVSNRGVLLLSSLLLSLILIAILFNRSGRFRIAGAIVACGLSGAFYTCILTNPAGLTVDSLLLFNGPIL